MSDIVIKVIIGIIVLGGMVWGVLFENRPSRKNDENAEDTDK